MRLDRDMKAFARRAHVPYISKRETFCGEGACPLLDRLGKLMIQDYGHWGVEAAAHFGRRLRSSYSTSNSLFASP